MPRLFKRGTGILGHHHKPKHQPAPPADVVAQGHLAILAVGKTVATAHLDSSWARRYFVLHSSGQLSYFTSGKAGIGVGPKGGALLSSVLQLTQHTHMRVTRTMAMTMGRTTMPG